MILLRSGQNHHTWNPTDLGYYKRAEPAPFSWFTNDIQAQTSPRQPIDSDQE